MYKAVKKVSNKMAHALSGLAANQNSMECFYDELKLIQETPRVDHTLRARLNEPARQLQTSINEIKYVYDKIKETQKQLALIKRLPNT